MIYTFIADISRLDTEAALNFQIEAEGCHSLLTGNKIIKIPDGVCPAPRLGDEVISHILSARELGVRRERLGAYILLTAVVKEMFGGMSKIERSVNGKPYFDRSFGIHFGISHSTDAVALSLCCDRPVGVDIEEEIDPERAARLEARFFSELSFSERKTEVNYIFVEIDSVGGCSFYPLGCSDSLLSLDNGEIKFTLDPSGHYDCFSAKWTLYEATLKCDGGGFTSLPCLGMLLLDTHADTKSFTLSGKKYYVSSAESR